MKSEIRRSAEASLGVTLPQNYVDFLDHYPKELTELFTEHHRSIPTQLGEIYGNPTTREFPYQSDLINDLKDVVAATESFRDWVRAEDGSLDLALTRFVSIGINVGGDYFLIDSNFEDSPVHYFDHETQEISVLNDDLVAYKADVITSWTEDIEDRARLKDLEPPAKVGSKPWWKFWGSR